MTRVMLGRVAAAVLLAACVVVPTAPAASAADASGCSGSAVSLDADGVPVDTVKVPGPAGTQANPFIIDLDGTVAWKGSTDAVITDATWSVSVMGLPLFGGDFANEERTKARAGTASLADLPFAARVMLQGSQVIPVAGSVSGAGGTCTASGYISANVPPVGTPLWLTAMALLVLSVVLLLWMILGTTAVEPGLAPIQPRSDASMGGG